MRTHCGTYHRDKNAFAGKIYGNWATSFSSERAQEVHHKWVHGFDLYL